MAAPTPLPPARAACWQEAGVWDAAGRAGLPDPRHPGQRWPPRPPGLAAVPAFRPSRGRRGGRSATWWRRAACGGAERAHARAAGAARVRAGRRRGGAGRRRRHGAHRRRTQHRLPAGRGGGGPELAAAARRRHSRHPSALRPDRHRLRDQPRSVRTTTRRSSTSCRPAHSRNCRCAPAPTRWKAVRPTSRRSCGPSARRSRSACWRSMMRSFADAIARRLGDHLGAVRVVGRRWSYPLGALHAHRYFDTRLVLVGRCGAHHPSDRRPGSQPGLPRCDGAGRPADRGVAPRRGSAARRTCCGATSGGGGRTIC